MEASERLVGFPVFKTGEGSIRSLAGSIPVRLRHNRKTLGLQGIPGQFFLLYSSCHSVFQSLSRIWTARPAQRGMRCRSTWTATTYRARPRKT